MQSHSSLGMHANGNGALAAVAALRAVRRALRVVSGQGQGCCDCRDHENYESNGTHELILYEGWYYREMMLLATKPVYANALFSLRILP